MDSFAVTIGIFLMQVPSLREPWEAIKEAAKAQACQLWLSKVNSWSQDGALVQHMRKQPDLPLCIVTEKVFENVFTYCWSRKVTPCIFFIQQ